MHIALLGLARKVFYRMIFVHRHNPCTERVGRVV